MAGKKLKERNLERAGLADPVGREDRTARIAYTISSVAQNKGGISEEVKEN